MLKAKLGITENTVLCLYLACWKLYFYKVIPAFHVVPILPLMAFFLVHFSNSGIATTLVPEVFFSFLLGCPVSSLPASRF